MTREIRFNAFDMNTVGHIQQGMWRHPRDQSHRYGELSYWMELAKTLERGLFDGLFLADVLGVYDVFGGGPEAAIRNAVQIPLGDPLMLIPAMAAVTEHLGFGVTSATTYEPPFMFARRMSTLDALTNGRMGWNIVTGYLDSAARAVGLTTQIPHDQRYDWADDYLDTVYRLWEGSWAEDALLRDRSTGIFTDPARVRRVQGAGQYAVDAMHLCAPTPQRTPVLYQAGTSTRGREFASTHAECVFVNGSTRPQVAELVADLRAKAKHPLKIFVGATIVTGRNDAEAAEKLAEYRNHASAEGALAQFSASTGMDFAKLELDEPIRHQTTQGNQSNVEAITTRSASTWTKRKLIESLILGSRQQPIVGGPQKVCDALQAWVDEADVDGFNLSRTVTPECVEDIVEHIVPELQARGVYKTAYRSGTLREKLFGHPRLPGTHRGAAAKFRDAP
jgi:FMN-dependent oxidoreductase (nitrilotriacetate monooxygenase family)